MGSVGVQINAAVEYGGSILTDGGRNERLTTWMVLDEVGDIVNDTGDRNESLAILRLLNEIIPVDNRKLFKRHTPVEPGALLVELLLLLLQPALLNLVLAESLEVGGQTELLPHPDAPLGGVVLVPLNGVAVIGGKLVMKVVVALTECNKSGEDMVARAVAVVKRLLTEPVGQGVDAESGLLDEEDTQNASIDVAAKPVTPADASNQSREDKGHKDDTLYEVPVLPDNDGVLVEIGDIGTTSTLRVLLDDHPANVAVQKTLPHGVGIFFGVGVSVVGAVTLRPPAGRTLHGTSANGGKVNAKGERALVAAMGPETMVSSGDSKAGVEVVWMLSVHEPVSGAVASTKLTNDGPDGSLELERDPVGGNEADGGNDEDEGSAEPVDVLVPVLPGHGQLRDMRLLGVVVSLAEWDVLGGAVGESRSLLRRGGRRGRRHGGRAV